MVAAPAALHAAKDPGENCDQVHVGGDDALAVGLWRADLFVAAGLGFIAQTGPQTLMLVVTLPMPGLGLYGALACLKFHKRSAFHVGQAKGLRRRFTCQFPDLSIKAGLTDTSRAQRARFPKLRKMRSYLVWVAPHRDIAVTGAALSGWIVFS